MFDYRKFLSFNYLEQFRDLFIVGSETNQYFFNRLFIGKCFIMESPTRMSTKDIISTPGIAIRESQFVIFCLSKPIIKFANLKLKEYSAFFKDMTDPNRLPRWMEMDCLYTFDIDTLKKDVNNKMIPYTSVVDFDDLYKVELVDCRHPVVRVSKGRLSHEEKQAYGKKQLQRMEKENPCLVFYFENMIECYKFYSYCKALIKNRTEFYNSRRFKVHYNLGTSLYYKY